MKSSHPAPAKNWTPRRALVGAAAILALLALSYGIWRGSSVRSDDGPYLPPRVCGPAAASAEIAAWSDGLVDEAPGMPESVVAALKRSLSAVPPVVLRFAHGGGLKVRVVAGAEASRLCPVDSMAGDTVLNDREAPGRVAACVGASASAKPLLVIALGSYPDSKADLMPGSIAQVIIPVLTGFVMTGIIPRVKPGFPPPAVDAVDAEAALWAARAALAAALPANDPAAEGLTSAYGADWADRPEALNRLALAATDAFYCGEATRAAFADLYPGVAAAYERTFACLLGPAWYRDATASAAGCKA